MFGIQIESELIQDTFNGRDGYHTHKVTLYGNGRYFETEITSGCGHRHYSNGRQIKINFSPTIHEIHRNKKTVPNKPDIEDVLYYLTLDANCVRFGQSFEEFCEEFGYHTDSRKAERAYNHCRDSWAGLIRLGLNLDELTRYFEDY